MRLFLSNLKLSRWGIVAWAGLMGIYALFTMYLYPNMKESFGEYAAIMERLPQALKEAMGLEGIDFSQGLFSLESYVAVEFLTWFPPVVAIYAVLTAGGGVAREVERGTMDLLLAQPVARSKVVSTKFALFLVGASAIALGSVAGLALGRFITGEEARLWAMSLAVFQGLLLVLAVGAYSLLFSCLFLDPRKSLLLSGVVTVVFYILNFIAPILGSLGWLKQLSLFHYFRAEEIARTGRLDGLGVAVFLGIALACFIASLIVFQRRDIIAA